MARWNSCNVFQFDRGTRHLWQFSNKFAIQKEEAKLANESLNAKLFQKDWQTLFQPRLNVAWLPPEHVFLRIIQLPRASFDETLSMVELQLEKLSPMPVTHVVWSVQLLPHPAENMQTAIVIIAARNVVEEFLGKGKPGFQFIGYNNEIYGVPTVLQGDSFAYLPEKTGQLDSYAALFDPKWKGYVALEDNYTTAGQKTALYLKGTVLDYSNKLIAGGFKFSNPNAKASCSCGESFSV